MLPSNPWDRLTYRELGFPPFPVETIPTIRGENMISYYPGMTVNPDWWYFIRYSMSEIRRFKAGGGRMDRCVVHFLSFDPGVIDPLWNSNAFRKRCELMLEAGVRYIVAPDFSAWADMPMALQIHNMYRSAVVTHDLAKAGFAVIPHPVSAHPMISHIMTGHVPLNSPTVLIDGCHLNKNGSAISRKMFWDVSREILERKPQFVLIWANDQKVGREFMYTFKTTAVQWVPARNFAQRKFIEAIDKAKVAAGFVEPKKRRGAAK